MNLTHTIASIVIFLAIAVGCIFFPERIQTYAIDYHAHHDVARKLNPFVHWMATPSYVVTLRIIGCLSLVADALLIFVKLFLR